MGHKLDRDPNQTLLMMRAVPYGVLIAFLTAAPAILVAHLSPFIAIPIGIVLGVATVVGATKLTNASGDAFGSIYTPAGSSTPPVRQFSLAESLVARGKYDEAAEAYELLTADHPEDHEPPLRMARLQRDKLANYDNAAVWFRKALAIKTIDAVTKTAVTRELIELYTHKLRSPAAALPYLSRLSDENAGTPVGEWAKREYAEIKQDMLAEHDGG